MLPHGIEADWVDCKRGTKDIVDYLVAEGCEYPAEFAKGQWVPVSKLWTLAERIRRKNRDFPEDIAYIFRETIRRRSHVMADYAHHVEAEGATESTCTHEYFFSMIKEIYQLLRVNRHKTTRWPEEPMESIVAEAHEESAHVPKLNEQHDAASSIESAEAKHSDSMSTSRSKKASDHIFAKVADMDSIGAARTRMSAYQMPEPVPTTFKDLGYQIEDDKISVLIGINLFLDKIDKCCNSVAAIWRDAGRKQIPFAAAAFLTEFIWHDLGVSDWIALVPQNVKDIRGLLRAQRELLAATDSKRFDMRQHHGRVSLGGDEEDETIFAPSQSLEESFYFQRRWDRSQFNYTTPQPLCARQTPYDCVKSKPNLSKHKLCISRMIDSIHKTLKPHRESTSDGIANLYHSNSLVNPGTRAFWMFLGNSERETELVREVESCLSLRLVLESHRGFIWSGGPTTASVQTPSGSCVASSNPLAVRAFAQPNPEKCRMRVLRLAQAFENYVEKIRDHPLLVCTCEDGLPPHVERTLAYLKLVRKDVKFSLYFHAPWVVGHQILGLIYLAFVFAMKTLSRSCYLGAVLHVYNVLTRYALLEPVELLEQLCHLFRDSLFTGGRPMHNYKNCYVVRDGGRPMAEAEVGQKERLDRRNKREEHIQATKVSFYHSVLTAQWKLDLPTTLAEAYNYPKERLPVTFDKMEKWKASLPQSVELTDRVREIVLKDFQGEFPAARLNFLAVFLACADIVQRVMPIEDFNNAATVAGECPCTMLTIPDEVADALLQVDCFEDTSSAGELIPATYKIRQWIKPIQDVMDARKPKDFLWEELV